MSVFNSLCLLSSLVSLASAAFPVNYLGPEKFRSQVEHEEIWNVPARLRAKIGRTGARLLINTLLEDDNNSDLDDSVNSIDSDPVDTKESADMSNTDYDYIVHRGRSSFNKPMGLENALVPSVADLQKIGLQFLINTVDMITLGKSVWMMIKEHFNEFVTPESEEEVVLKDKMQDHMPTQASLMEIGQKALLHMIELASQVAKEAPTISRSYQSRGWPRSFLNLTERALTKALVKFINSWIVEPETQPGMEAPELSR